MEFRNGTYVLPPSLLGSHDTATLEDCSPHYIKYDLVVFYLVENGMT